MKKKTLLYITELFPIPAHSGAKIKTINTIQTLSKKFNIVLLCFSDREIDKKNLSKVKKHVKFVKVFQIPNLNQSPKENLLKLINNYKKLTPFLIQQFHHEKAHKFINKLIRKIRPDIIHIDHLNMAQYLPKKKQQVWIHEQHNVEYELAWSKFLQNKKTNKTKIYQFIEFILTYLYELRFYRKFDHIFTISEDDKETIKKHFFINNISHQKIVYNAQKDIKFSGKNQSLLFLGDLTWEPNITAINWFVENVYNIILETNPDIRLDLVGKIENDLFEKLKKEPSICVHGYKKNIGKFLNNAAVFIMPFQSGAGVRIKALTAMSYGIPIVSTKIGIKGIKAKSSVEYINAYNNYDFAQKCSTLINSIPLRKKIGENGYDYLRKNHSKINNRLYCKKYLKVTQEFPLSQS